MNIAGIAQVFHCSEVPKDSDLSRKDNKFVSIKVPGLVGSIPRGLAILWEMRNAHPDVFTLSLPIAALLTHEMKWPLDQLKAKFCVLQGEWQ